LILRLIGHKKENMEFSAFAKKVVSGRQMPGALFLTALFLACGLALLAAGRGQVRQAQKPHGPVSCNNCHNA
jgi:hypothetical protein